MGWTRKRGTKNGDFDSTSRAPGRSKTGRILAGIDRGRDRMALQRCSARPTDQYYRGASFYSLRQRVGLYELWMAQDGGQVIGGMHAALGSAFSASPADLMVPEDRGALAAPFARLRTPEAMHIMMICVDQEYRSQGVGKTMMLEAESLATGAGTNLTALNVRGDNPRAIELYSRLG